jgi:3D (Asp-Asp-Asp) domain-containing protein
LSILLQSGVNAQNPTTSQNQAPKSSGNNPSANTDIDKQLALVSDNDKASDKAKSKVKSEAPAESVIAEPKVSLKNPSIEFKVRPSESKLSGRAFANPNAEILGEPRTFQATAYALRGRTRSGVYVRRGVIAADPRVIPLGSVVHVKTPGYSGVYTVHDTGRKIKGNIIDVWVPSTREARIFGRRKVKLHVLRHGPTGRRNK